MDINSLFPSQFLKAADFAVPRVMTIARITVEDVGSGEDKSRKPVLHFAEGGPGLVLNKTNASFLAHSFGNNTDHWLGRPIEARSEPVQFQGRVVSAIRVRAAPIAAPTQPTYAQPAFNATVAQFGSADSAEDIDWS